MKRKPNPELVDKENPEWTEEDFRNVRPAAEVLPELVGPQFTAEMLKPRGRPKAAVTKSQVNIRLDADVLEAFKATGRGWQTRINRALRDWLREEDTGKPGGRTDAVIRVHPDVICRSGVARRLWVLKAGMACQR
jgi:uncharacterized protein (DUF4415 family)